MLLHALCLVMMMLPACRTYLLLVVEDEGAEVQAGGEGGAHEDDQQDERQAVEHDGRRRRSKKKHACCCCGEQQQEEEGGRRGLQIVVSFMRAHSERYPGSRGHRRDRKRKLGRRGARGTPAVRGRLQIFGVVEVAGSSSPERSFARQERREKRWARPPPALALCLSEGM